MNYRIPQCKHSLALGNGSVSALMPWTSEDICSLVLAPRTSQGTIDKMLHLSEPHFSWLIR